MHLAKKLSILLFLGLLSCDVHINKNFDIEDDSVIQNDLVTVNGNISIGKNCTINGNLSSVNGYVRVGNSSTINASINCVNGDIELGQNCSVKGDVTVLTGLINIEEESQVNGNLSNISGDIEITSVDILGDIITNFGNVTIANKSTVQGSIIIEDNSDIPEKLRKVKITISDSSYVNGNLDNNNRDVIVSAYIEPGSSVSGQIIDVDLVKSLEELDYE